MRESLIQNDPIIKTLFEAITTDYIPACTREGAFTSAYVRAFLTNLGISSLFIRKILTELFKDIKYLEALNKKLARIKREKRPDKVALYYIEKLQKQTLNTIVCKILRDDKEQNAVLLYAKLQVLRKYQERCASPELFSLIAQALYDAYEEYNYVVASKAPTKRVQRKKDLQNIINISEYVPDSRIQ